MSKPFYIVTDPARREGNWSVPWMPGKYTLRDSGPICLPMACGLKKCFADGELDEISVIRNFRTTASGRKSYSTKHDKGLPLSETAPCVNLLFRSKTHLKISDRFFAVNPFPKCCTLFTAPIPHQTSMKLYESA